MRVDKTFNTIESIISVRRHKIKSNIKLFLTYIYIAIVTYNTIYNLQKYIAN